MATVRIRVGASLDANTSTVFRPLVDAAKKARAAIDAELGRVGPRLASSARAGTSEATRAVRTFSRSTKRDLEDALDPGTRAIKKFGDEAKNNFALVKARFADMAKEAERDMRKTERAISRVGIEEEKLAKKQRSDITRRQAVQARVGLSLARGAAGYGMRLISGVAQGAGVDLDLSSHVARNVELERRAQELSNAGYMPTDTGANAQRVSRGDLMRDARAAANATAFDPTAALEGLQKFVGKTGDLALGRDVFKDLAVLSKATGTNLEDMVDAAGDVANQMGPVDDKGNAVLRVMRAIAGQGKLGAVEIRDMSSQMAKVAAAASMFEGDRGANIALMGAFAQEARQQGGAASATQAATGVGSFINTFSKGARVRAFKAFGVNLGGATPGSLRSPEEIVIDAMRAASSGRFGGMAMFNENMGKMISDAGARRTVRGFEKVYRDAYAGSSGANEQARMADATKAVREEFERLKNVAMGQGEILESFNRQMTTTEAQAQLFNNAIGESTQQIQAALLPAMQDLAPLIVSAAQAFSSFLTKLSGGETASANRAETGLFNDAAGASRALGKALRTQHASQTEVGTQEINLPAGAIDHAREIEAALAEQVAKKRAALEEQERLAGSDRETDLARVKMGPDQRREERSNVDSLQAELTKLHERNERVAYLLENHILKVVVTNPEAIKPPPAAAPVVADNSGRMPADASEE